jgi:Ca2+-binding EF-hand superfamily protein
LRRDGFIDQSELAKLVQFMGLSIAPDEIVAMMNAADADDDG